MPVGGEGLYLGQTVATSASVCIALHCFYSNTREKQRNVLYLLETCEQLETHVALLVLLHMFQQEAVVCQVAVREQILQMGFYFEAQILTFSLSFMFG